MLRRIEKRIFEKGLLSKTCFDDIDALLDARDEKAFDAEWMRVYTMLKKSDLDNEIVKQIDSIRENSFMRAYALSKSGDIASCVSDDFELICKAYVLSLDDSWLASLVMVYGDGQFPCGALEHIDCSVSAAVNKFVGSD